MRRFPAAVLAFVIAPAAALAQNVASGTYLGVDKAAGARIVIAPTMRRSAAPSAIRRDAAGGFQADRLADTAEAVLDMEGRTVLMRVVPLAYRPGSAGALPGRGTLATELWRCWAYSGGREDAR